MCLISVVDFGFPRNPESKELSETPSKQKITSLDRALKPRLVNMQA